MVKKHGIIFSLAVIGIMCSVCSAKAGEINGNEASVISAAQGTFEYQGKRYVAVDSYVSQLQEKMAEDDVDLTAEQASEAIAEIYSNVATGVKEGYLQEVRSQNTPENTGNSEENGKNNKGAGRKASSAPDSTEQPRQTNSGDVSAASGNLGDGTDSESGIKKPKRGKFELKLGDALKAINITEQTSGEDVYKSLKSAYIKPIVLVSSILLIVLFLITIVLLVIKKKGKFSKIWSPLLGLLVITAGIFMAELSAGIGYGIYSGKVLVSQVTEDGYYHKIYNSLNQNIQTMLTAAGFPEDVLETVINEKTVYLDGKLTMEACFIESRRKEFLMIQDEAAQALTEYLMEENYSNVAELSGDITNFSSLIQNNYQDCLKFTYADYLKEIKEVHQKNLFRVIGVGVLLVLLGVSILLLTQKYIHRIFRVLGWSSLISAVAVVGGVYYGCIFKQFDKLKFVPTEYNDFFGRYLFWNSELMIAIAVMGILLFAVCCMVVHSLKKIHMRNPWRKLF